MLIYSTVAAVIVFVLSNHYFAGDARYLAIGLFAGFVSLAVYLRGRPTSSNVLAVGGSLLMISALLAGIGVFHTYRQDVAALEPTHKRNELINNALTHHNVDVLAGDYGAQFRPVLFMTSSSISYRCKTAHYRATS